MSVNISSLYKIDKNDKVFIDTNILIFLFSPGFVSSQEYQVEKYSKIFEKLVENKNEIYINAIVVSEFINKCLRIDFEKNFQNQDKTKKFKEEYRVSEQYKKTIKMIYKELKRFFDTSLVTKLDDSFQSFDIFSQQQYLTNLDFNDLIVAKNVIENNLKLLTDDRDFTNINGININWYMES